MIKEKELNIQMTSRNITYYKKLGYNVINGNTYNIKIEDVNKNSKLKITAICEKCDSENYISIEKYYKNFNNHNYYGCKKCSKEKFKLTSNILFGVDNPMKNKEIKEKAEKTNLKKYGYKTSLLNDEVKEKIKKTNLEKYGTEIHLENREIRDKIKNTNLERYGVEYPAQNKNIENKIKNTNLKKYGFEHPAQNEKIKQKIKDTNLEKYGNISPFKSDIIKSKLAEKYKNKYKEINIIEVEDNHLIIKCDICDHSYKISKTMFNHKMLEHIILCPKCNPSSNSFMESKIIEFISENYSKSIILNSKSIISPLELDIYLPDLKLAFEYNGIYWHNEVNKDNNYHLNKTEECEKLGIQLIHIWEDEWLYKREIIKSIILNKLGKIKNKIYAIDCEIKKIDNNNLSREFLNNNNIQGFIGSKIKIGLFYEKELVSLMTFDNKNIINEGEYNLLRFCNILNTDIIEGEYQLFNYFIKNYNSNKITVYSDRSISQGKLYKKLGFKYEGKTDPNYFYVINRNRYNKFNFRKDKLVMDGFDINKTEHEIMLERKIYRIYDSGNLKFVYYNNIDIK